MLVQVQGVIAEYERAKIMERSRRRKLHKARTGSVNVLSNAPYGYCYFKKSDGAPAHYQVVLHEAHVVRRIFEASCESTNRCVPWRTSSTKRAFRRRAKEGGRRSHAGRRHRSAACCETRRTWVRRHTARPSAWSVRRRCGGPRSPGGAQEGEEPAARALVGRLDPHRGAGARVSGAVRCRAGAARSQSQVSHERALQRLVFAYEAGAIDLSELTTRSDRVRTRIAQAREEIGALEKVLAERRELQLVVARVEDFAQRLRRWTPVDPFDELTALRRELPTEAQVARSDTPSRGSCPVRSDL